MKRFLFIGHDARRTGAPMVLLHFLRWAKINNPEWTIDLLLLQGGELENEYSKVANLFVIAKPESLSISTRGLAYVKRRLRFKEKERVPKLTPYLREYDCVIGNTVVTLEQLEFFKRKGFATICWMHELEYAVKSFFTVERFLEISAFADEFIIPSKAVERFLREAGVNKKMTLIYEFSPSPSSVAGTAVGTARDAFGIPAAAFVVIGSGTVEWRKGVDLFLLIAARITPNFDDIYFLWVGGKAGGQDAEYDRIQFDLCRLGLTGRVIFAGFLSEPHPLFHEADIFALTSREDPFPLVCLEAASLAKPIICFADAGGMPEFVEDDAGAVILYGNIEAFADSVLDFYNDRPKLAAAGKAAKEKTISKFSPDKSCEELSNLLSNL